MGVVREKTESSSTGQPQHPAQVTAIQNKGQAPEGQSRCSYDADQGRVGQESLRGSRVSRMSRSQRGVRTACFFVKGIKIVF